MNMLRQETPARYNRVGVKWYSIAYIIWIDAEDSLIITGSVVCFVEKGSLVIKQSLGVIAVVGYIQWAKVGEPLSQRFVKDEAVCYRIIRKFCRSQEEVVVVHLQASSPGDLDAFVELPLSCGLGWSRLLVEEVRGWDRRQRSGARREFA